MLPPNIDLTDGQHFRQLNFDNIVLRDISMDDFNQNIMSKDTYMKICRYEDIFGKKFHENGKHRIFDRYLIDLQNQLMTNCHRCGVSLNIPWRGHGCLCDKCRYELDIECDGKIPWTKSTLPSSSVMEIFKLR